MKVNQIIWREQYISQECYVSFGVISETLRRSNQSNKNKVVHQTCNQIIILIICNLTNIFFINSIDVNDKNDNRFEPEDQYFRDFCPRLQFPEPATFQKDCRKDEHVDIFQFIVFSFIISAKQPYWLRYQGIFEELIPIHIVDNFF